MVSYNANSKDSRPNVLHITAEYPNAYRNFNTPAVRNLVKGAVGVNSFVIAIRRTANPLKLEYCCGDHQGDLDVISLRYWALPYGVLMRFSLYQVATKIYQIIQAHEIPVDIIHAHKLTTEGVVAYHLSQLLGVPYMLSIRGESESKVYRFKPLVKPFLNQIVRKSSHIFYVSAWFKPTLNKGNAIAENQQSLLPNFVSHMPETASSVCPHLISILDLNMYKKKGLDRLLEAFALFYERHPEVTLQIYGGGSEQSIKAVKRLITRYALKEGVRLNGAVKNEMMVQYLAESSALVLPSHNESFGMVYVESLLAGVPILYSNGTGIDGFIDDVLAKEGVNPKSTLSIYQGLENIWQNRDRYRQWLLSHRDLILKRFGKEAHLAEYERIVNGLVSHA